MTWRYDQSSGDLFHNDALIGRGYSGHPPAVNDGTKEAMPGVGPIPRGRYVIGPPRLSPNTGPLTMSLEPVGHTAHGRTLIRMHGDNRLGNRSASHGCVIMGRAIREAVAASPDKDLEVVA